MPKKKLFYEEAKKWFNYAIGFDSEESKAEFKNYVHNIKLTKGTPIYQTVKEMMELHKEKYQTVKEMMELHKEKYQKR